MHEPGNDLAAGLFLQPRRPGQLGPPSRIGAAEGEAWFPLVWGRGTSVSFGGSASLPQTVEDSLALFPALCTLLPLDQQVMQAFVSKACTTCSSRNKSGVKAVGLYKGFSNLLEAREAAA